MLDSAPALGLPEVMLGLVPGWGGAYCVPNLIGADNAVSVIIENPLNNSKTLGGKAAFELGLADAVFGGADFLEQSLLWAARVLPGEIVVERPEVDRGEAWDAAVARGRGIAESKTGGAARPPTALELIAGARDRDRDEGFAAEDDALEAMSRTPSCAPASTPSTWCRSGPSAPPVPRTRSLARPVTKVGIVGAGLMATQLALLFLRRLEVPVVLTDLDQERVDKGVGYVHAEIDKLLGKGRINQDKANRLKALVTGAIDKARRFADADFVIEAVFEEMSVKKQVFADVERSSRPSACSRPTPPRCRSPRWRPTSSTRSGSSASTSSTRSR